MKKKIEEWCNDRAPLCAVCGAFAEYDCIDEFHVQVLLCEKHSMNDIRPWNHNHAEIEGVIHPACPECNKKIMPHG